MKAIIPYKLLNLFKDKKNIFLFPGVILFIGILSHFLSSEIYDFYRFNYGVVNVHKDFFAGLVGAFFLTFIILLLPFKHKNIVLLAWIAKLFIVFVVDYLFESRYPVDAHYYFAIALEDPVFIPKPFAGIDNIVVLISYLTTFLYPSYRLCVVVFAFAGFMAQYIFYRSAARLADGESKKLLIVLLFFPSVIFWSHILGKEPVVFLMIAVYFAGMVYFCRGYPLKAISLLLLSFAGFFFLRFWLAGILGISFVLSCYLNRNVKWVPKIIAAVSITVICFFIIKTGLERFHVGNLNQYFELIELSSPISPDEGRAWHIEAFPFKTYLLSMPHLMFTNLFRPLIFEAKRITHLLAGIENTVLLIYFLISLWHFLKYKLLKNPGVTIMLIHIIIWSAAYSSLSIQSLGIAVRYKLQVLPFILVFIYLSFYYRKKANEEANVEMISKSRDYN
jgi:hypothetical protein